METKRSGSATTTAVQITGYLVFLISLEAKYQVKYERPRNLRASVFLLTTAGSQSETRTVDFVVKHKTEQHSRQCITCSYITLLENKKKQRNIGHFTVSSLQSDR